MKRTMSMSADVSAGKVVAGTIAQLICAAGPVIVCILYTQNAAELSDVRYCRDTAGSLEESGYYIHDISSEIEKMRVIGQWYIVLAAYCVGCPLLAMIILLIGKKNQKVLVAGGTTMCCGACFMLGVSIFVLVTYFQLCTWTKKVIKPNCWEVSEAVCSDFQYDQCNDVPYIVEPAGGYLIGECADCHQVKIWKTFRLLTVLVPCIGLSSSVLMQAIQSSFNDKSGGRPGMSGP